MSTTSLDSGVRALQPHPPVDGWRINDDRTALFALQADPRFSYCLYLPADDGPPAERVLVSVHGSERDPHRARDALLAHARRWNIAVLAPLFPIGVTDPSEANAYKFLGRGFAGDVRHDELLLAMLAEAHDRFDLPDVPIDLAGFSGGAQFVHRFCYVHPDRVRSVCVASPGCITPVDPGRPFPLGTADQATRFGGPLDLAALRRIRAAVLVGDVDSTRIAPAQALHRNWQLEGVDVSYTEVAGAAHDYDKVAPVIVEHLDQWAANDTT